MNSLKSHMRRHPQEHQAVQLLEQYRYSAWEWPVDPWVAGVVEAAANLCGFVFVVEYSWCQQPKAGDDDLHDVLLITRSVVGWWIEWNGVNTTLNSLSHERGTDCRSPLHSVLVFYYIMISTKKTERVLLFPYSRYFICSRRGTCASLSYTFW